MYLLVLATQRGQKHVLVVGSKHVLVVGLEGQPEAMLHAASRLELQSELVHLVPETPGDDVILGKSPSSFRWSDRSEFCRCRTLS